MCGEHMVSLFGPEVTLHYCSESKKLADRTLALRLGYRIRNASTLNFEENSTQHARFFLVPAVSRFSVGNYRDYENLNIQFELDNNS